MKFKYSALYHTRLIIFDVDFDIIKNNNLNYIKFLRT